MPDILAEICARKRAEVADAIEVLPLSSIETMAREAGLTRDFTAGLEDGGVSLVAEIKRASPSRGEIAPGIDPVVLAKEYEDAGAAAISVLTDRDSFAGSLADLESARAACSLPLLRKDFMLEPYQVYEARASGADAVLLIVAALDPLQVADLIDLAADLSMAALVEVHNRSELEIALDSGAGVVGVNNRDLKTFEVSLTTCLALAESIPSWVVSVAESGIFTRSDVQLVESAGFDAVLVGESLLVSGNVGEQIRELLGR